jgi:ABC-type transporter Mla maintaining outer membrane lipid asymmetry permease subunit MlaE
MEFLQFLASLNPYGIINWVAAAYALYVARKTKSVLLLIVVAANVVCGITAIMSSGV